MVLVLLIKTVKSPSVINVGEQVRLPLVLNLRQLCCACCALQTSGSIKNWLKSTTEQLASMWLPSWRREQRREQVSTVPRF